MQIFSTMNGILLFSFCAIYLDVVNALCSQGYFRSGTNCLECRCHHGNQTCDPMIGCTSGPCQYGFTGMPQCQTPCSHDRFGEECHGVCHCPPQDSCDSRNGLCHTGKCLHGWTGPSCQIRLPELRDPPSLQLLGPEEVKVTWERWTEHTGLGEGPVAYYQLQYLQRGATDWITATTVKEAQHTPHYTYTVSCLQPGTEYSFRLVLGLAVGDKNKLSVPSPASAFLKTSSNTSSKPSTTEPTPRRDSFLRVNPGDSKRTGLKEPVVQNPIEVTLLSKTKTSLSLHLSVTGQTGNTVNFQVGIKMTSTYSDQSLDDRTIVYTSNTETIDIYDLLPASKYNVKVSATNDAGNPVAADTEVDYWTLQPKLPSPPNPVILNCTDHTMYIEAFALNGYNGGPIGGYRLMVEEISQYETSKQFEESIEMLLSNGEEIPLLGYDDAVRAGLAYYMAKELVPENITLVGRVFVIGDGSTDGGMFNAPLKESSHYIVWVNVHNELGNIRENAFSKSMEYAVPGSGVYNANTQPHTTKKKTVVIFLAVVMPILGLLLIGLLMCYCMKQRKKHKAENHQIGLYYLRKSIYQKLRQLNKLRQRNSKSSQMTSTPLKKDQIFQSNDDIDLESTIPGIRVLSSPTSEHRTLKSSSPIKCEDIVDFYNRNSAVAVVEQYKQLPEGITEMVHVSLLIENQPLNRSVRALTYDKNRVKLMKDCSIDNDYINASKVKSHMHKFYIVTQCPMSHTQAHFWQMIWEQNVDTIVMLMDVNDGEMGDYQEYWPQTRHSIVQYGNMQVRLIEQSTLAHFQIRLFELLRDVDDEKESHLVAHFQYKAWVDSSVPHHPISFLNFVKRIHDTHSETSNITVHCHLGAGRSGLFVAVDSLLYEGKVTRKVDVVKAVTVLRMERPNLVHTKRQYQFVYEVLCEAFHHRDTRLEANKFEFTYENMLTVSNTDNRSLIAEEYESIISNLKDKSLEKSIKWTEFSLYISPCKQDLSLSKAIPNQSILHGYPMPLVMANLDSHLSEDKFVITLYPNNNEKCFEFWEMVFDLNSPAVVMINDTELHRPPYWPAQGDAKFGDNCSVWTTSTFCDASNTYYTRNLEVRKGLSQTSPAKHVKHFQYIAWPQCKEAPPVRHTVNFLQQLRSWYYRSGCRGPLMVHSANGISRASLFCVLWEILERLDEERVVDIYRTTRYTQAVVSAAVTSLDQYRFLYKAVKEVLNRERKEQNNFIGPGNDERLSVPPYRQPPTKPMPCVTPSTGSDTKEENVASLVENFSPIPDEGINLSHVDDKQTVSHIGNQPEPIVQASANKDGGTKQQNATPQKRLKKNIKIAGKIPVGKSRRESVARNIYPQLISNSSEDKADSKQPLVSVATANDMLQGPEPQSTAIDKYKSSPDNQKKHYQQVPLTLSGNQSKQIPKMCAVIHDRLKDDTEVPKTMNGADDHFSMEKSSGQADSNDIKGYIESEDKVAVSEDCAKKQIEVPVIQSILVKPSEGSLSSILAANIQQTDDPEITTEQKHIESNHSSTRNKQFVVRDVAGMLAKNSSGSFLKDSYRTANNGSNKPDFHSPVKHSKLVKQEVPVACAKDNNLKKEFAQETQGKGRPVRSRFVNMYPDTDEESDMLTGESDSL